MSSSSQTNAVDEQLERLLYQKGAFGRKAVFYGGQVHEKRIIDAKDPALMRLHQSLAIVCASAVKPSGASQYVVRTEVVACHIQGLVAGSEKKELTLWLCKNSAWEKADKGYVAELLRRLQDIGHTFTETTINHSNGVTARAQLTILIYRYCKEKVWSRLGKLVTSMRSSESKLPANMRESKRTLEAWLERYEQYASVDFGLWRLADASNYCRKNPISDENLKMQWPLIVKRWNKVASYSASFNNLVTWALGIRSYASYKGMFLDGRLVQYSVPVTRKMDAFTEEALKAHFLAIYKTPNPQERAKKLAALVPLSSDKKTGQEEIFVHAEMHIAPMLAHDTTRTENDKQYYIGISKPCCFLCFNAINALQGKNIAVRGTHGKLYPNWMIPAGNKSSMDKQEVKLLEGSLDKGISEQLLNPKKYPPTADSIYNSQNTNDLDLQPSEPPPP